MVRKFDEVLVMSQHKSASRMNNGFVITTDQGISRITIEYIYTCQHIYNKRDNYKSRNAFTLFERDRKRVARKITYLYIIYILFSLIILAKTKSSLA